MRYGRLPVARGFACAIALLALECVASAQFVAIPPQTLELQAGEAWNSMTFREKMSFVSGVLVGAEYLAWLYDEAEQPAVPVDEYYSPLYLVPNREIVLALDRIYSVGRYYKVPIIVLVFNFREYLKEL